VDTGYAVPAAVAAGAWLVAVGLVALRRRPAEPRAGAPTLDLGPEPPAVVNFLTSGFRVTPAAVPATLLDLAARDVVELEHRGPDQFVCRLGEAPAGLTPYDQRVVDHLRSRARGGIVPAEALTTGPADEASSWRKAFTKEVVADAQQRGLSQPIVDLKVFTALFLLAAAPAALMALLFEDSEAAYWTLGAAFLLLAFVYSLHSQRETPAGLAAASRWLGVQQRLAEDEVFPTLPPITVELWERYLAYGAALGVAPAAVRAIPMGAESDTHAMTSYGGRWRAVEIAYPNLGAPGWGLHPGLVLLRSAVVGGGAVLALYLLAEPLVETTDGWKAVLLVAVTIVPLGVIAARQALTLLRAVLDLSSDVEVRGQVLRLRKRGDDKNRRYYVAVDDGVSKEIRAFRVSSEIYSPLRQGQLVVATITPRLRYVRGIQQLTSVSEPEPPTQVSPPPSPSR
jgi:hypothetical protein